MCDFVLQVKFESSEAHGKIYANFSSSLVVACYPSSFLLFLFSSVSNCLFSSFFSSPPPFFSVATSTSSPQSPLTLCPAWQDAKGGCVCWLPEVDAFSVGQDREGSTQRSLSTDQHDPATQTRTHTDTLVVLLLLEYFYMCKKTGMNLVIIVEQQPRETEK